MPPDNPYIEKEMLARLHEGDEKAFRYFFDTYSPKINAYAIRLTRSVVIAQEIVQDIFTICWEKRSEIREIDNMEAWLITLARNAGSSMLRRMAHEKLIIRELDAERTEQASMELPLEWKQFHQQIYTCVLQLSPQQRKVWIMSRHEGRKQQQIAEELGISVHTVKEYLKKATAALRKNLIKFILFSTPSFFAVIRLLHQNS